MKTFLVLALAAILFSGCSTWTNRKKHDCDCMKGAHHESSQHSPREPASAVTVVQNYPLLERVAATRALSAETVKWMERWKGMDLEDTSLYQFPELSGSTSVNLKVERRDSTDPKGSKSLGTFVPRNGAGNPNTELAYFNLAVLMGVEEYFRPATRYELGPRAQEKFRQLINQARITNKHRLENKAKILAAMATGQLLKGCMKAKKLDSEIVYDEFVNYRLPGNGGPRSEHPLYALVQATSRKPRAGQTINLKSRVVADELEISRQLSILMTFDVIFQQWDRYSGGNFTLALGPSGKAQIYATDNGGAGITREPNRVERNLGYFSRYDKALIDKLAQLRQFLREPSRGYFNYTNAEEFVVDLGLYFEGSPRDYVDRLGRNIDLLLQRVEQNRAKYGNDIFL